MANIGIVGAGFAGLQLALKLQQHGVATTLYSDKTSEQILNSRMPNNPVRFARTLEREHQLKVNHWDNTGFKFRYVDMYVGGGPMPLAFRGDLAEPGSAVDPRLYCSMLLKDYQNRGGQVVIGALTKDDLVRLSAEHHLMVVSSGRGSLVEVFERIPEYSPYTQPQRNLVGGYYNGISRDPNGMHFIISAGHGEFFQTCVYTHEGLKMNLLIEGIPGGDFDSVTNLRYEDDPAKFNAAVLDLLRRHAPTIYNTIDPKQFGVVGTQHILQGAITPTVRRAYAPLGNGKFAVAIGDVHVVNDPIIGQGANNASHSAWVMAQEILTHTVYNEAFCKQAEQKMLEYVLAVTNFSNAFLQPPPPHVINLLVNATQNQTVADAFIDGFANPTAMWDMLSNPANAEAFIQEHIASGAAELSTQLK